MATERATQHLCVATSIAETIDGEQLDVIARELAAKRDRRQSLAQVGR